MVDCLTRGLWVVNFCFCFSTVIHMGRKWKIIYSILTYEDTAIKTGILPIWRNLEGFFNIYLIYHAAFDSADQQWRCGTGTSSCKTHCSERNPLSPSKFHILKKGKMFQHEQDKSFCQLLLSSFHILYCLQHVFFRLKTSFYPFSDHYFASWTPVERPCATN